MMFAGRGRGCRAHVAYGGRKVSPWLARCAKPPTSISDARRPPASRHHLYRPKALRRFRLLARVIQLRERVPLWAKSGREVGLCASHQARMAGPRSSASSSIETIIPPCGGPGGGPVFRSLSAWLRYSPPMGRPPPGAELAEGPEQSPRSPVEAPPLVRSTTLVGLDEFEVGLHHAGRARNPRRLARTSVRNVNVPELLRLP